MALLLLALIVTTVADEPKKKKKKSKKSKLQADSPPTTPRPIERPQAQQPSYTEYGSEDYAEPNYYDEKEEYEGESGGKFLLLMANDRHPTRSFSRDKF